MFTLHLFFPWFIQERERELECIRGRFDWNTLWSAEKGEQPKKKPPEIKLV